MRRAAEWPATLQDTAAPRKGDIWSSHNQW